MLPTASRNYGPFVLDLMCPVAIKVVLATEGRPITANWCDLTNTAVGGWWPAKPHGEDQGFQRVIVIIRLMHPAFIYIETIHKLSNRW